MTPQTVKMFIYWI